VVTTDLAESYRAGLSPHLAHATRVADPFHVVRVGNRCLDKVRRRVQQETLEHRGRKDDPLYRIRKLLVTGTERLDDRGRQRMLLGLRIGDPRDEVLGAWLAKESVRDVYLTDEPAEAATLVDKAIAGCAADDVEEIRSLGRTLAAWRTEILAHHDTGASNGPTEGLSPEFGGVSAKSLVAGSRRAGVSTTSPAVGCLSGCGRGPSPRSPRRGRRGPGTAGRCGG
jgi:transposase